MNEPKLHAGFRFPASLIEALDSAASVRTGYSRTDLVQEWLAERALAEGWLTPEQVAEIKPNLRGVV